MPLPREPKKLTMEDLDIGLMLDMVERLHNIFRIDLESNKAVCRRCDINININYEMMVTHYNKNHKEQSNCLDEPDTVNGCTDYGKRRSQLKQFGIEHSIKLNYNSQKGFCNICNINIKATKNVYRTHVSSVLHTRNLEWRGLAPAKTHIPCTLNKNPINSSHITNGLTFSLRKFWKNGRKAIRADSFLLLFKFEDQQFLKIKCYACDEYFPHNQELEHCLSEKHKTNFNAAKVIGISKEFIREIKPNLFHCGFCNYTLPFWDTVVDHLMRKLHTMRDVTCFTSEDFIVEYVLLKQIIIVKQNDDSDAFYKQLMQLVHRFKGVNVET